MATIDAHHMRDREMEGVAVLLPPPLPLGPISIFFALGMVDTFDDAKPVVEKEAVEER